MKENKWDRYLMSEGCEVTSSTMEGDKSAVEPQIDGVTLIKQLLCCDGESGTDASGHLTQDGPSCPQTARDKVSVSQAPG